MKEQFTYLQRKELKAAERNGLNKDQMCLLENCAFNYLQMREIRQAMENGIEEAQLKLFARPWIQADEMHAIAEAVQHGKKVEIPKKKIHFHIPLIILVLVFMVCGYFFFKIQQPDEPLKLELVQEEITIPCGEMFEPQKYVKEKGGTDAVLHLPEERKMERPGVWLFSYEVTNGKENIQKILRVNAVDSQKPVIRLKQEEAVIYKGIPFSCHAYVESAVDEMDGSLSRKVKCSDELKDGDQTVTYTVKDSSGNEGTASLKVHHVDPLENEEKSTEKLTENNETVPLMPSQPPASVPALTPVQQETDVSSVLQAAPEYTYETETIEQWSEDVQSQEVTVEHSFS